MLNVRGEGVDPLSTSTAVVIIKNTVYDIFEILQESQKTKTRCHSK